MKSCDEFNVLALEIFHLQAKRNAVYKKYVNNLGIDSRSINQIENIPFLPIEFFKTHEVLCKGKTAEQAFLSSGTTGQNQSKHYVAEILLYRESFRKCFEIFYGKPNNYIILALLPSYLEQNGSSLVFMMNDLIEKSSNEHSGFYLHNLDELAEKLKKLDDAGNKILLFGVSFALLDLAEKHQFNLRNTIVMETGGMKGRRKEPVREELHEILCSSFGVEAMHSEYGMTELLSQAYSAGKGVFRCPPWLKILTRDVNDPFQLLENGKTGGINIIDLANIHSCSFIATQDLGKVYDDDSFEVLGRFDHSDLRGCNLMVG
ncbi:acyltransferase [Bacteroidales bacterium AH-315-I05]|nr:acyltransferase [Bacteroidales bacterium AH-315-I05]